VIGPRPFEEGPLRGRRHLSALGDLVNGVEDEAGPLRGRRSRTLPRGPDLPPHYCTRSVKSGGRRRWRFKMVTRVVAARSPRFVLYIYIYIYIYIDEKKHFSLMAGALYLKISATLFSLVQNLGSLWFGVVMKKSALS
jgi:hypothetical protein